MMYQRLFQPPLRSFFLLGPRGTGKTTWLKNKYKKSCLYDLLTPSVYLKLKRQPELFRQEVSALPKNALIVIDEVQKLPILLDDVQYFLTQRANKRQFIFSGSSARKLKKTDVNLLGGRASRRFFYPLVQAEHQNIDQIDFILRFGTLPEVLNLKTVKEKVEFLESYTLLYLREEIQQEAVVKNIDSFSDFLNIAGLCNGQVINLSSLGRDSGTARTTLMAYFQALEDTLTGSWLKPWRPRARVKESQKPKFFFFDCGVARALAGRVDKPLFPEERGFLLETYLLNELKFWNQNHGWKAKIQFWKTHHQSEIDFILEVDKYRIGLEIKTSSSWKKEFGRHIEKAQKEKIISRGIGVYLGEKNLKKENIEIHTLQHFLKMLEQNSLFGEKRARYF